MYLIIISPHYPVGRNFLFQFAQQLFPESCLFTIFKLPLEKDIKHRWETISR